MKTIRVELGERSYPIHIGSGARAMLPKCNIAPSDASHLVIIADSRVAELHLEALSQCLPTPPLVLQFDPGETRKSLASAAELYDQLAAARFERSGVIIAFGGGVAGDLAGFVAGTWQRGVPFIQVPTTLLAAVDASVGGKTGVNLRAGKNLVGVFHQPSAVIVDTDFLATLPDRDMRAGLAETVKQAVIRDPTFLHWHEANVQKLDSRDGGAIETLIARSCEIKAEIVALDERESGVRAVLNYGHTIGHALEHLLEYELRHGECVGLGMIVENEIAVQRGVLPEVDANRIRDLLERLGLPLRLPRSVSDDEVAAACHMDKKVRERAINFVLLREIGQPWQAADITDAEIVRALRVIRP